MRVLVIDDHSMMRMAWRYLLQEIERDVSLSEAESLDKASSTLERQKFDLVITELPAATEGGAHGLASLVTAARGASVIVFAYPEAPAQVRAALACGVRAYVPKRTETQLISTILRLVLAGGIYVPPTLAAATPETTRPAIGQHPAAPDNPDETAGWSSATTPPARPTLPPLTRRQFQVLELMSLGLSNAEIGQRMGLNLSTVKSHVTGVLRALQVESRTQAVLTYKQADWGSRRLPLA